MNDKEKLAAIEKLIDGYEGDSYGLMVTIEAILNPSEPSDWDW